MDGPPASCRYPPACRGISRPESGKPDSGRRCPGLITNQARIIQHPDRATPTRAVITDQEYSTRSGRRPPVNWRSSQAAGLRQPTAWKSALMLAMPARGQVHGEVTAAVPGGEVTRERIHAKPRLSVTIYLLAQA